jgi:hypothetical protein
MVSIMTLGKPCSGAKTLGWEHSIWEFENVFENLGIAHYSNEMFSEIRFLKKWRKKKMADLKKRHCV